MRIIFALVRRTVGRIGLLLAVIAAMLAGFEAVLVAVAVSLEGGRGFEKIGALVPASIQQAFGLALTSFGGMAAFGFFEPLIMMLVVQFAIYLATEPAGDVESGLVDLLLSRPLPRHYLVTRSLLVMTGVTIALVLTMAMGMWASLWCGASPDARWPEPHVVVLLMAHLTAVAWCFGGIALAAAACAPRRGTALTIAGIGAVAAYLMEVIGNAWPRAAWLAWLSPFHRFHGPSILAGQADSTRDLTILVATGAVGVAFAYWQFQRRDV